MFYLADLYGVLNLLFNATIWILILLCGIKIVSSIKYHAHGVMIGFFSFLNAKDIPLRSKTICLIIGGMFLYAVLAALLEGSK